MSRERFRVLIENAKSGDMKGLFELLKAIAKKIAEDKARQNKEMAQKLLELEGQSREMMEELMDVPEPKSEEDKRRLVIRINRLEGKIFTLADLLKKYGIRV